MTIGITRAITIANIDANTDFSLVDVLAITLYWSESVFIITRSRPYKKHRVKSHWAITLSAVEGNEPSLTTVITVEPKIALVDNTERSVSSEFCEQAILIQTEEIL